MEVLRNGRSSGIRRWAAGVSIFHRKKLQEKSQENPYFTLNCKENSGFPDFFSGSFFLRILGFSPLVSLKFLFLFYRSMFSVCLHSIRFFFSKEFVQCFGSRRWVCFKLGGCSVLLTDFVPFLDLF